MSVLSRLLDNYERDNSHIVKLWTMVCEMLTSRGFPDKLAFTYGRDYYLKYVSTYSAQQRLGRVYDLYIEDGINLVPVKDEEEVKNVLKYLLYES